MWDFFMIHTSQRSKFTWTVAICYLTWQKVIFDQNFFVDLWLEKFQNWDLICDLIRPIKKLKFSYHHQFQVNRREMSYHCFPLEKEIWKEIIWKNLSIFWPDIKTSTESIYKRNIYWTGWEMKMWILELHLEFLAVF